MSSQQQQLINEYIKDASKDPWNQHYPEDDEFAPKLYDIFTFGDELYMYTRFDIMCEEIRNFIDSLMISKKIQYC